MNEEITINEVNPNKKVGFWHIAIILIAFISVINTILLIGLMSKPVASNTVKSQLSESKAWNEYRMKVFDDCVSYSDFEIVKTEYSNHINGSVKNKSDKDLYAVSIDLKGYDAFGDYVGTESVYVEYLPANTSCKIDSYVSDETESVKVLSSAATYYDDVNP